MQTPTEARAPTTATASGRCAARCPFAGHPSLGTAVAVAEARGRARGVATCSRPAPACSRSTCGATATRWHASMLQEPATFGAEVEPHHVMAAVGPRARGRPPRAARRRSCRPGSPTLIAPVADESAIASAAPDFDLVERCSRAARRSNLYLVWLRRRRSARGRGCSRSCVAGGEDPATGSAAGPLCAYLHARGVASRVEITRASRWAARAGCVAEIDGDRVRVERRRRRGDRGEVLL